MRAIEGFLGAWIVALGMGCGASPPPPAEEPKEKVAEEGGNRASGPSFESEIGAGSEPLFRTISSFFACSSCCSGLPAPIVIWQ